MNDSFFALISRMRHITRWGLMRNSEQENIQEHSHMVAVLAHGLAVIRRDVVGVACDPNEYAVYALFHDATEIITGDLPTPVKYSSAEITAAYHQVEALAANKLLDTLPESLHPTYAPLLHVKETDSHYALLKAADRISAYIKCIEERKAGNDEFISAERGLRITLEQSDLPEVQYFLTHFLPAFAQTLDEIAP